MDTGRVTPSTATDTCLWPTATAVAAVPTTAREATAALAAARLKSLESVIGSLDRRQKFIERIRS
ncbi:hypothetical protein QP143_04485 [Streptococcus agalactiae]|nr:hypothetical protein [Streptococcus agalactiae]